MMEEMWAASMLISESLFSVRVRKTGSTLSFSIGLHCVAKYSLKRLAFSSKDVMKVLFSSNGGILAIFLLPTRRLTTDQKTLEFFELVSLCSKSL